MSTTPIVPGNGNGEIERRGGFIHRLVEMSLRQRFLVLMLVLFMAIWGVVSFSKMPVDAYPDLSPPMVEIITQWPGHAAEEIERLVTLPLEVEMNGVPRLVVMRSITLYGLSDVRLTFQDDTDSYFARQNVFQRLSEVNLPQGVTPTLAPLFSPSGLVYRYVLESPDRTPQQLKTIEDWVIERAFSFIFLHAHDVDANLLSIGAIDFGIIIGGTVVMMENIYRELAQPRGAA